MAVVMRDLAEELALSSLDLILGREGEDHQNEEKRDKKFQRGSH